MSNRELDNLFKTKLEDLERKPSANAWERIQAGKQQKKGRGIWFYSSIAAAVVLLIAFAGIFLLNNDTDTTTGIATVEVDENQQETRVSEEEKEKQPLLKSENSQQLAVDNAQNVQPEQASTPESNVEDLIAHSSQMDTEQRSDNKQVDTVSKVNRNESLDKGLQKTASHEPNTEKRISENNPDELKTENSELKTLDIHATNTTTVASTNQEPKVQDKGQTITFNIEDFKAATVATTEEKEEKRSPLKKVVDFAKNLKEGDAGLGELREAKNELFALNFKKENDNSK